MGRNMTALNKRAIAASEMRQADAGDASLADEPGEPPPKRLPPSDDVAVAALGLSSSIVSLLLGAEVATVGQARVYLLEHRSFERITGIGPKADKLIQAAIAQ